jgi:hypothetical protein
MKDASGALDVLMTFCGIAGTPLLSSFDSLHGLMVALDPRRDI